MSTDAHLLIEIDQARARLAPVSLGAHGRRRPCPRGAEGLAGATRTYPNRFDAHPPFQIDGNFGGAAGSMEMLVQSWGGDIRLLPALPRVWPDGSVRGVKGRGGITIDMSWVNGQLREARLAGPPDTPVRLYHHGRTSLIRINRQGFLRLSDPA